MASKPKDKFFKKHVKDQAEAKKAVNNRYPKFSFEFCFGSKRGINHASVNTKKVTLEKMILLSQNTWHEIKELPREQSFEKIKKSSFNSLPGLPDKFKGIEKIDVFRLPSKVGRLIGYIEEDTFFVVWIDTKFDMYDH